ncbi:diguanylate cyclase (GGDEF)-like protein [Rhodoblastus acidophilus]|uniref:diguanylate cyclase n=1 Tax=Rhodoblastus acidophilus TaxID=1074 RepID=UPI002225AC4B|nr:diguanylate cyclase [Rhodoblastus acidophilus]MCW2284652.1 diguanylate cyclase (GGDEF)-like protein [Rhodoblastus acidophilus]MCW2333605.1 diguanylate cyclase (GGDEF)-like protein [Rhodoblastus acidophilus]
MQVTLVAADQDLQASITSMLETRGHEVTSFAQAREGLDHLERDQSINAFVVVNATDASAGAEICWDARLLSSFERPVYVCLVAPPLSSQEFIEALDCGADDVLQLPISADELYARLRAAERLNQMQHKLIEMATRDGLTGLYNRPAFFQRAATLCAEHGAPFAGVMADIDHFKAINDSHGHAAGDRAIRAVADCLKSQSDIVGRLGGEEFAVLLDIGDPAEAWRKAERMRRQIAMQEIDLDRAAVNLSCSFGIAIGEPGEEIDDLLRKADAALYAAKRAGRNMVALYDPDTMAVQPRAKSVVRSAKTSAQRRAAG